MSTQIPLSQPRREDDGLAASQESKKGDNDKGCKKAKAKAKGKASAKKASAIGASQESKKGDKAKVDKPIAKAKGKAAAKKAASAKATAVKAKGSKVKDTESKAQKDKDADLEEKKSNKKGKVSAKEKIRSWSLGLPEQPLEELELPGDEDEEEDADGDDGASSSKDRIKARKFKALIDAKQVPDFVLQEWQKTLDMKSGKRAAQKALSDNFFTRGKDGKLVVNLQNKYFENIRDTISCASICVHLFTCLTDSSTHYWYLSQPLPVNTARLLCTGTVRSKRTRAHCEDLAKDALLW